MKRVIGMWMGIALVAGIGLCACSICCCGGGSNLVEGKKSAVVPHQAGTAIDVRGDNGSIQVVKADRGDVEIVATIRARTQERLDGTTINAQRGEDGTLRVTANWPAGGRHDNESCSFEIAVPEAVGVTLETSNGAVSIAGLSGPARLHTSNGAIHATDQNGPVEARTSNGGIHAKDLPGARLISSEKNRLVLGFGQSAAKSIARTSNGSITVRM